MSLYSNPIYFQEHLLDCSAPEDTPPDVSDLLGAYKNVTNPDNYNVLERFRKLPTKNKNDKNSQRLIDE